nr:hypothetical protein [Tanacetum cinerariifolium]GFC86210.1 hypothetical protein [Tanacetum cinerariifolium]
FKRGRKGWISGSGGDGNAAGAIYFARRSPTEGDESEDMEVCGRIVILAAVVAVSVDGGGMMGSGPSGGEASSSIDELTSSSSPSSPPSMG